MFKKNSNDADFRAARNACLALVKVVAEKRATIDELVKESHARELHHFESEVALTEAQAENERLRANIHVKASQINAMTAQFADAVEMQVYELKSTIAELTAVIKNIKKAEND